MISEKLEFEHENTAVVAMHADIECERLPSPYDSVRCRRSVNKRWLGNRCDDAEILLCLRKMFATATEAEDYFPSERVDCLCDKPCEVPLSPSVVDATGERPMADDGEVFSSGDELDKFESDTDSQDTVIEGEAYKRIRSVAIKEKILHANEELFGTNSKETFFNTNTCRAFVCSNDSNNGLGTQMFVSDEIENRISPQCSLQNNDMRDVPELPLFSDPEEPDAPTVFSSLEKHFRSFKKQNLPIYPQSVNHEKPNEPEEIHNKTFFPYNEAVCSSESSDNGSDGEEVILSDTSTSSDEATYIGPSTSFHCFNHPVSYKLHTIAEESCEESERNSWNSNPVNKICSDFEYFDKMMLSNVKNQKKENHKLISVNSVLSPHSESKNVKGSAFYSVLATCRLEKYFQSGLQDGSEIPYADEDMTDESGGISSDEEVTFGRSRESLKFGSLYKNPNAPILQERQFDILKCSKSENSSSLKSSVQNTKNEMEVDLKHSDSLQYATLSRNRPSPLEFENNAVNEQVSDEEAKYIMNHLMQHITNNSVEKKESNSDLKDMSPMLKVLETEIARLMLTVSPASLSTGEPSSSCSSTIGSNNSDYGSDTLESAEGSTSEEDVCADITAENRPAEIASQINSVTASQQNEASTSNSGQCINFIPIADPVVSEETLYICKQLLASLKKIADSADGTYTSDEICVGIEDHSAKQYITDQIVSLMQTVNASHNNSPLLQRLSSNTSPIVQIDSDVSQDHSHSDSESPSPNDEKREHLKSKTPSESGSETTISASISIPSYDDSDCTPTESEISHEMDELYALLESNSASQDVMVSTKISYEFDNHLMDKSTPIQNADSPLSEDGINFAFSDSIEFNSESSEVESSLLHSAASKLQSLLPISIEERIARYKDAFLNKVIDHKDQEIKANEARIKVILPQPSTAENKCDKASSSSLVQNLGMSVNSKPGEKRSVTKSYDDILSSCNINKTNIEESNATSVTSVKIISHNTYPPSSAIHKILSNSIDSSYLDQKHDYKVVNISDAAVYKYVTADGNLSDKNSTDEYSDASLYAKETESTLLSPLPKIMIPKEKASSENDLLIANYRTKSKSLKVFGTKSVGNICELESISNKSAFRDTGYYSYKSSEESFLSLDDSTVSQTSTTSLTQYRSLTSTETIPEEEESSTKAVTATKISLSSSNIPDAVCDTSASKSSTLPLSLRSKLSATSNVNHRTRSSFFSTSGVLRKLNLLRDESGNSLRSSPHGRLRMRNRSLSGGSEDGRQRKSSVPQLSASDCFEIQVGQLNNGISEKDNFTVQDEDNDQPMAYHSRSQMSLSSFGGRSESITSVYSAAGGGRYGTVIVTGDVLFGINYNYKLGALEINIKECRNLAAVDSKRNRSDPYVKVYLLPDRTKSGKRKTKVKKHTLNPVFDEILRFHVTVSELEIRTLWLSVWHSDRFGRNDFLGEAMLPLGNDIFENSGLKWYPLQERLEAFDAHISYKGDLILALKYVPPDVTSRKFCKKPGTSAKGALEILVREARNLMATRSNGTSDPFCKSYLLPDKSKTGKQKTPVFKKSCNPKWNHSFVYDNVSLDDLQERCLELTIWDYDKITSNDFLGGVRLCLGTGKYQGRDVEWMDSVGEERLLWQTMLERPNTWIDGSLLLRPSMQSRRTLT